MKYLRNLFTLLVLLGPDSAGGVSFTMRLKTEL